MDYKKILATSLLSDTNVNYIVKMILDNYKISKKAIDKCNTVITGNLKTYLEKIDRYPTDKEELTQAISFLNKKCYDDFEIYLSQKYPGVNLKRDLPQKNPNKPHHVVEPSHSKGIDPSPKMIVLDEQEATELIKTYGKEKNNINNDFLQYLANPLVIQSLSVMLNQLNLLSYIGGYKIDSIIDEEQAKKLMEKTNTPVQSIDISNVSIETLPKIKTAIEELNALKATENDAEALSKIEEEQKRLASVVVDYKNKLTQTITETQTKLETYQFITQHDDSPDNLDLTIDPTNSHEDLKNIVIKINHPERKKLSEIILVSYKVPFNENNVTRFNNTFVISYNDNVNRFFVPPGNYDIESLLQLIESKTMYLSFSVFNNIVKIVNKYDVPFDLDINADSLFTMLGFVGDASNYKGEKEYTASKPYDIDCHKQIFFSIGMSSDPLELKFNDKVELNKVLKKFKGIGGSCNQIKLSFLNKLNQVYDFDKPFQIFLQLKWT